MVSDWWESRPPADWQAAMECPSRGHIALYRVIDDLVSLLETRVAISSCSMFTTLKATVLVIVAMIV